MLVPHFPPRHLQESPVTKRYQVQRSTLPVYRYVSYDTYVHSSDSHLPEIRQRYIDTAWFSCCVPPQKRCPQSGVTHAHIRRRHSSRAMNTPTSAPSPGSSLGASHRQSVGSEGEQYTTQRNRNLGNAERYGRNKYNSRARVVLNSKSVCTNVPRVYQGHSQLELLEDSIMHESHSQLAILLDRSIVDVTTH